MQRSEDMRKGTGQTSQGGDEPELREAACSWVARLSSGEMTGDDMVQLRSWLGAAERHRVVFDQQLALWRELDVFQRDFEASATGAPSFYRRLRDMFVSRPARQWIAGAMATACMALVMMSTDVLTRIRSDFDTSVGEVREVRLPDGSLAILNTDTALSLDFSGNERGITLLRGEAWFQVVKNAQRPFRVHTQEGVAEAVGTAFAVRNDADRVVVAVTEGTVAVSNTGGGDTHAVRVKRGEQVAYTASEVTSPIPMNDASDPLAWRDGRLLVDDATLSAALDELDRYRPGRILLMKPELAQARVSGVFSIRKIDEGLEGLASTYGFHITQLTPYIVIIR